jgi:hypothetical protein
MNRKEDVSDACFALWRARVLGNPKPYERLQRIKEAKVRLIQLIKRGPDLGNHPLQRDELNRRQREANLAGVSLYREFPVASLTVYIRKW